MPPRGRVPIKIRRQARRALFAGPAAVLVAAALGRSPRAALAARPTIAPETPSAERRPDSVREAAFPHCAESRAARRRREDVQPCVVQPSLRTGGAAKSVRLTSDPLRTDPEAGR